MPRKAATRKKPTSSRKASIASLADDASEVSNMDDVANLASLDDFDHKENIPESNSVINTSSVADKKKMQSRSVLAKQQLLKAFDMEVESRCRQLRLEAEGLAAGLKQSMAVWKVQLPSRVRTMKLSEFVDKYNGNINSIFEQENNAKVEALATPLPRRSERINKQSSRVTSTDDGAQVRADLKTPQTASKTIMRAPIASASSSSGLPSKQLFSEAASEESKAGEEDSADLVAIMRRMLDQTASSATSAKTAKTAGKRGQQSKIDVEKTKLEMLKGMLADYEKKLASL